MRLSLSLFFSLSIDLNLILVSADQTQSSQQDIVFLLDSSDDMQSEFSSVLNFVESMVGKLNVYENKDRVSVVQYSKEPTVEFFLNTHKTLQNLVGNVRVLSHRGGRLRRTGAALQYVIDNVFTASSGSRHQQGVSQILILFTGGRSTDDVRNAMEKLNKRGVMVFVVGTRNADALEIQTMTQDVNHAFFASDTTDLLNIEQQIFSAIITHETIGIKPSLHGKTANNVLPPSYPHFFAACIMLIMSKLIKKYLS